MCNNNWIMQINEIAASYKLSVPLLFYQIEKFLSRDDESSICARDLQYHILECVNVCNEISHEIRYSENNFTMHDIRHSFNVMKLMGQLVNDIDELSILEIGFLIYSALLHDIGMIRLGDEEISAEEIREYHGERSKNILKNNIIKSSEGVELNYGMYHQLFIKYLPDICASHMRNFQSIIEFPQEMIVNSMKVNLRLCAVLLRLSDAMDISSNRAPFAVYNLMKLRGTSDEHWKKHMIITDCSIFDGKYRIEGNCDDEKVLRILYKHLDIIHDELKKAIVHSLKGDDLTNLSVNSEIIISNIRTIGYTIRNNTLTLDYNSISKLFMGEHLYGTKRAGLREIIQNSIDACLVRESESEKNKQNDIYIPQISISLDNDHVYVRDNGIGMSKEVIEKYFLNVGLSYYRSTEFRRKELSYNPMGFFGIGFLACFMLSDDIVVKTACYNGDKEYILHLVKFDRFVTIYEHPRKDFVGTEICFEKKKFLCNFSDIKKERINEYEQIRDIKSYIENMFWRLVKLNQKDMIYKLRTNTFYKYASKRFNDKKYAINLSEYLLDIEGVISFNDDQGLIDMWKDSGIKITDFISSLQSNTIEIEGSGLKSIPFYGKSLIYKNDEFVEIKNENDLYNKNDYMLTFICRQDNNFDGASDLPVYLPQQFREQVFSKKKVSMYGRTFIHFNPTYFGTKFYQQLLNLMDKEVHSVYILEPQKSSVYWSIIRGESINGKNDIGNNICYLKSAKIKLPSASNSWLFFKDFSTMINIQNENIEPQASRSKLIELSEHYVMSAIEIAKYLWLLKKLEGESNKVNNATIHFLKKEILELWNNENPLLKKELKPD